MKYKAVIFDLFGTLIDTGSGSVEAAAMILRRNNRTDLCPEKFYSDWKQHYIRVANSLDCFKAEEYIYTQALAAAYQQYKIQADPNRDAKVLFDSMLTRTIFPDTTDILSWLKGRCRIIIGSNSDKKAFYANIKQHGIEADDYFCSEDLQVYKPAPLFYAKILQLTAIACCEALWIGDSPEADVIGPRAAGIAAIWLDRIGCGEAIAFKPENSITSLADLKQLL